MERAENFRKENKLDEARISLLSALEANPENAKAYYQLAEIFIKQKSFQKAL